MRRRRVILLGAGLLIGGLVLGAYIKRETCLRWVGEKFLPKRIAPAPPWDAIIVLSGRPFERSLRAAELYYQSPAPVIALGGAHNDDLLALGYYPSQECAFTASALRSLCVPDSMIHTECVATSTYEEVLHIRKLITQRRWRRIVIVSSPFHGRRIERLMEKWVGSTTQWGVAIARPLQYQPEWWWTSEAGLLTVFEEGVKTLYYAWKGYL